MRSQAIASRLFTELKSSLFYRLVCTDTNVCDVFRIPAVNHGDQKHHVCRGKKDAPCTQVVPSDVAHTG